MVSHLLVNRLLVRKGARSHEEWQGRVSFPTCICAPSTRAGLSIGIAIFGERVSIIFWRYKSFPIGTAPLEQYMPDPAVDRRRLASNA